MNADAIQYFRDQFRLGRAEAVKDAEAFSELLFAIERLGAYLTEKTGTLNTYLPSIQSLAKKSPLAQDIPEQYPCEHLFFSRLYEVVMQARNDALHQGAYARHLTHRAIEMSIVLEDALMTNSATVAEFMVRDPLCCSLWQPLSFIRQQMLANSFSFLPVKADDNKWYFVSDRELARFLRVKSELRKKRLAMPLSDPQCSNTSNDHIQLILANTVSPSALVVDVAKSFNGSPLLVTRGGLHDELVGIITAFDLL